MIEDSVSSAESKKKGAFNLQWDDGKKIFNNTWNQDHKPVEMYRTDFISAMKVPDSQTLNKDFVRISDPWKQEYDKGVQVPVDLDSLPKPPYFKVMSKNHKESCELWTPPKQYYLWQPKTDTFTQAMNGQIPEPVYDMDEIDVEFLNSINQLEDSKHNISELQFESIITYFDASSHVSMVKNYQSSPNYNIQYDDSVYCEVCKDIYSEHDNDMIFCDSCNICVHQSCYGIPKVPSGEWYCAPCKADCFTPVCLLCMQGDGAFKSSQHGEWIHIFCALWIPEVGFGNVDKMEPITKIKQIPSSRWSLLCCFCQERVGACIQCSVKDCYVSFHPTCAYENRCHMMTVYGTTEKMELVKNYSYCLKHSSEKSLESVTMNTLVLPLNRKKDNNSHYENQCKIINSLQKDFFEHIDILEVSTDLNVNVSTIQFIFDFWKEKRMINGNNPLISLPSLNQLIADSLKPDTETDVQNNELDPFFKLVSLRQDLERARVLIHMSERRERMKKRLLKSVFSIVEQCFQEQKPLPFILSDLGMAKCSKPKKLETESLASDDNDSLNLSQSSLSKVFSSPQNLDVFSFESDNKHLDDNNEVNTQIIVAQEVVLNDAVSDSKHSDNLAYSYRSSEDPEWKEATSKRKKDRKRQSARKMVKMKEFVTQFSRKITIALSDKSDIQSSQDDSCHFTTPPTSPEFKAQTSFTFTKPSHSQDDSSMKRKLTTADNSDCDEQFVLANTPPSPKIDKENMQTNSKEVPKCTNDSDSNLSLRRTKRTSKRRKLNTNTIL